MAEATAGDEQGKTMNVHLPTPKETELHFLDKELRARGFTRDEGTALGREGLEMHSYSREVGGVRQNAFISENGPNFPAGTWTAYWSTDPRNRDYERSSVNEPLTLNGAVSDVLAMVDGLKMKTAVEQPQGGVPVPGNSFHSVVILPGESRSWTFKYKIDADAWEEEARKAGFDISRRLKNGEEKYVVTLRNPSGPA